MRKIIDSVSRFIRQHSMLEASTGVLVAVSGGADSVALLDVLIRVISRERGASRIKLHVAHLNHKLRGGESDEDAAHVSEFAKRLDLPLFLDEADVYAAAERSGRGIEETAREIRYDFLLRTARESGSDRIATGHTMNDQAETFLMRLVRGAGLRGLSSMRPIAAAHEFKSADGDSLATKTTDPISNPNVLTIRPLLCITRGDVEAYCRDRKLQFRTDSTNLDLRFTRNRIRAEVLPALEGLNPRVVEAIARAAENIAGDEDVLDKIACSLLAKARVEAGPGRRDADRRESVYAIDSMIKPIAPMRRRMIIEATRLANHGVPATADAEVTSAHIDAIEALLEKGARGKHVVLPAGLEVWRDAGVLVLRRDANISGEKGYSVILGPDVTAGEACGFRFDLQRGQPAELLDAVIGEARQAKGGTGRDWMTVALDDHALPETMVIRPRSRGERAHVLGQRRTKKLKNLMIDHRIPTSRRANWPVVTTPDGCYIWSPGLPPALKFASNDETLRIATLRASAI